MLKNVQQFFGFNIEEEDLDQDDDIDLNFATEKKASRTTATKTHALEKEKSNTLEPQQTQGIGKFGLCEIKVETPTTYDDSIRIAADLRNNIPTIVKLDVLNNDEGKRLIDFLCGTAYAINGHMLKISDKIFMFTPATISIIQTEQPKTVKASALNDNEKQYLHHPEPSTSTATNTYSNTTTTNSTYGASTTSGSYGTGTNSSYSPSSTSNY